MPILLSQLVMRPVLVTIAVLDAVLLLGLCGYLAFTPGGSSHWFAPTPAAAQHPADSATDLASPGGIPVQWQGASISLASGGSGDGRAARALMGPIAPASAGLSIQEDGAASAQSNGGSEESTRENAGWVAANDGLQGTDGYSAEITPRSQVSIQAASSTQPIEGTASYYQKTASADDAEAGRRLPSASVPLAFSAFNNGTTASPTDAATLENLKKNFVDALQGANQDPESLDYAERWQAAQVESDANFRRLFGWQAFVQAQLAQLHGGG